MFDIKWIRENPEDFDRGMARRGLEPQSAALIALDAQRRDLQTKAQEIQSERNRLSKEIGAAKSRGEDAADIMDAVSKTKAEEADAEKAAAAATDELNTVLSGLPNLPADDVPDGPDETANVEIRTWGDKPKLDFTPKEHFDIGEALGLMDFERAAKMSGARFVLLSGALARMERALANFMLDLHINEHGLTEINPPALVNDSALYGTGQLPKFGEDLFQTSDVRRAIAHARDTIEQLKLKSPENYLEADYDVLFNQYVEQDLNKSRLWMIPTAEVPLTNMVAGEILDTESLPRRVTAMTWCFRSEAGAAGKDTRGMIRQHQFTKVEMVTVCTPETSNDELERMTNCAEEVLKRLGLAYRTVVLSTGDMGFGAQKTYDIEVWLPGQDQYREISSCSNCGDFQARRMKARYRDRGEKGGQFVHTLNGSGLAVGRTMVAILEYYQQADGSVVVPEALRPYMGGLEVIAANGG
ncbi:MAG: serine--tRNA ligase [Alphaproteobacteria bacterium]|nr:serine--tRNA ligase [Alphaproteobacteria bacterium]